MAPQLRIFFTGMFISFLGSLPLGTLNVAAAQISLSDGLLPALYFILGALIAEILYVRLSLIAMDWVRRQARLLRMLEWVTLFIVLALSLSSFYAASHPQVEKNVILSASIHRFWLGLIMSALNPVQIPFWFGWSTVLFTKKILKPIPSHYNLYVSGIALGTILGSLVFVFGGRLLGEYLDGNSPVLHWVVGGIFALTALLQAVKMIRHRGVDHRLAHPEEETAGMEDRVDQLTR